MFIIAPVVFWVQQCRYTRNIFFFAILLYIGSTVVMTFCRPEMVVGWYHSHPGFGCWLSGVDINTQQSFEALSERAVAVVVDPIQSVKGKVSLTGSLSGSLCLGQFVWTGASIPPKPMMSIPKRFINFSLYFRKIYKFSIFSFNLYLFLLVYVFLLPLF